ncbi:MAG: phage portal protein [Xanthomonadales bacterium]|nr:phage portal protein [Xanthomonadales bacterium]
MAGLYTLSNNGVKMSIGELDRLMDEAIGINAGKMTPIQAMTVPLAFRAVDMIAGAVSRMPYYIEDSAENDVIDESTPRYWSELMYKLTASLLLFNGAYCLKESNQFGLNSRYRFLPSPLVRWDTSKGEITRFEYNVDGVWTNIPNFDKSLLWWWWPNLTSEVGPGVGPMNAALQDIGLASSLTYFAESYFSRGGFPLTILITEGNISEPEKVLSWWNAMVRGARQAFKAILLTNKITPTVIGSNIKDTIAPELYSQAAHNVAIAFGIPLSLLLSDAANYATALGDHVRFYTELIIPLAERIFEQWNERVYEPQGLEIECDPSQLEIMQAYQLETAAAVVAVVGKPVLTVDEGREILGYDPMEDDALDEPQEAQPAQPVAEQPATPEPVTESPDEMAG